MPAKKLADIQPLIDSCAASLQSAEKQLDTAILINSDPLVAVQLESVRACLQAHHATANQILKLRKVKTGGPGTK